MKFLRKLCLLAALCLTTLSSQAALYSFSYSFDASVRGTPGHILTGVVDGTLQEDGDTIVINDFLSVSLAGFAYDIAPEIGIRAEDPGNQPIMSLSGTSIDFWVCVQGFTQSGYLDGGDCPFGTEGGFLISDTFDFRNPDQEDGSALAGIPELVEIFNDFRYRDFDDEINKDNWSAEEVFIHRVSFAYYFEANIRGVPWHLLEGVVEGVLLPDGDTLQIGKFKSASLESIPYRINKELIGIRAADAKAPAVLSLSGNSIDFWVCPMGFTTVFLGGGDCPFGTEGGFLISDNIDFFDNGDGAALAGIPEFGADFRDFDSPINRENWTAVITKIFKPKKSKKSGKSKQSGKSAKSDKSKKSDKSNKSKKSRKSAK